MKTSDKIITTILILAILGGGGYFAYKHFVLDRQYNVPAEQEGIETVELWNISQYGGWHGEGYYETVFDDIVAEMESSPATYFTSEYEYNTYLDGYQTVSQTDKATFEATINKVPIDDMFLSITNGITNLWSTNFVNDDLEEKRVYNNLDEGDVETLISNNVELECVSAKIDKLLAANSDINPYARAEIIAIGTAEVKTIASDGDITSIGYGNVGETVTIKFKTKGIITFAREYEASLNSMNIERVD